MTTPQAKNYTIEIKNIGEPRDDAPAAAYTDTNYTLQVSVIPQQQDHEGNFSAEPQAVRFSFAAYRENPHTHKIERLPKSKIPSSEKLEEYITKLLDAISQHTGAPLSAAPNATMSWESNYNTFDRVFLPNDNVGTFMDGAEEVLQQYKAKKVLAGLGNARSAA